MPPINKRWSEEFQNFVSSCLTKNPDLRPSATELLNDVFLKDADNY
jgi:serine/threonine protein kinase